MKVIPDANILMSCLMSARPDFRETLLESGHEFFAPNFLFSEIFKHKVTILRYSKLNEEELYEYLYEILERIEFFRPGLISRKTGKKDMTYVKRLT